MTQPGQGSVIYTDPTIFNMPVLIDTGSTLSYFREDLVAQIGQEFDAVIDSGSNYVVDCKYREQNGTVDFGFNRGGMQISVSYSDFIYEQYSNHCLLGVQPADVGSTDYVLGDTFIRGAYRRFCADLVVAGRELTPGHSGLRPAVGHRLDEPVLQLRRWSGLGRAKRERHRPHRRSLLGCIF